MKLRAPRRFAGGTTAAALLIAGTLAAAAPDAVTGAYHQPRITETAAGALLPGLYLIEPAVNPGASVGIGHGKGSGPRPVIVEHAHTRWVLAVLPTGEATLEDGAYRARGANGRVVAGADAPPGGWTIENAGGGEYTIHSPNLDEVWTVPDDNPYTQVKLQPADGSPGQKWRLQLTE